MESRLILILSGAYIGYVPAHYAQAWVEQGQLRPLRDERYSCASLFYLVTQRSAAENPLINRFRRALLARSPAARGRESVLQGATADPTSAGRRHRPPRGDVDMLLQ